MKTRTVEIARTLADLEAIDRRLAKYDAEGVGQTDFHGARARATLHDAAAELAYGLGELYEDAGDRDGLTAAAARQEAHAAAFAHYRKTAEAARRELRV